MSRGRVLARFQALSARIALAIVTLCLVVLGGAIVAPRLAWAAPEIRAELDSDIVALGDSASVSFQASAEDVDVDAPDPGVPGAVRVDQTSVGPMHTISIINGVRTDRRGLRATWVVTPTKVGTFKITPSVVIGGKRVRARALELRVVPQGKAPQKQNRVKRGPPSLVDPFSDPFGDPLAQNPLQGFFDLDDPLAGARPGLLADPNLAKVDAPRGRIAFLHAEVDKPRAVVGEQVTYSVYLYVDAEQAEPRFEDIHESGTSDFLRQAVVPEDKLPKVLGPTSIAGHVWVAKLLRKVALFPLKTGALAITPMQVRISSGRTQGALRESEALRVEVSEPPLDGRPPGAVLGNVGKYKLTATVTPREIEAGGALSVELELEGTGNLPSSLPLPPRKGVEWLPPEVKSAIAPDDQGQIGGRRTFTYIVRAHDAGTVDLGEITVPFFDPSAHRYDVARAALGSVVVKPGGTRTDDAPTLVLEGLPRPRLELDPRRKSGDAGPSFVERPTFWWAWLASPVLALAFVLGSRGARALSARRAAAKDDPRRKLRDEVESIERALKSGDAKAADAAVVRYVEECVAQRVGIAIRALEQGRIASELTRAGVDAEVAGSLAKVLGDAATARFAPSGGSAEDARARFRAARAAVERLGNAARRAAATTAVLLLVAASLVARPCRADETDDRFGKAAHALEQGKPEIAIGELEALADRGVIDAHASFDRGLAYAERVRLGGAQPGDLGRAVHGFEEARRLTRDGELRRDADRALRVLRTEIARQRARNQAVELESLALSDSLAAFLDADGWGLFACATALLLSVAGLFANRLRGETSSAAKRLRTGAFLVGAIALPMSVTAAWLARTRASERVRTFAVVIAPEARLGTGPATTPLPEGAIVEVTGREGGRTVIRWGLDTEAVSPASIRLLAHAP